MTRSLFPELDDDRQPAPGLEPPADADQGLDPGPEGLLQRRLPAAGFVRYIENPTPTFDLPRRQDHRFWGICAKCERFTVTRGYICAACGGED